MNQQYMRQFSTNEKETFEGDPYSERLKKQQATKDQQDSNTDSAKSEVMGFWENFIENFYKQGSESSDKQQQSSSQFSSAYQKPDFLQDSYDHLNKEDVGVKDDEFLPDYLVKDAPTYKRNPVSINLPWLINGAPSIDIKTRSHKFKLFISILLCRILSKFNKCCYFQRFMGEQIFSRMKLHKNEVLEHLFKIYRAVLLSSQDRDFDFLEQYCEETFYTKLRNRLNELKMNNIYQLILFLMELFFNQIYIERKINQIVVEVFALLVEEDMFADRGKPITVEANMYDHTVIKGLSPIRRENGSENDYVIFNDIENMGFISYVPKQTFIHKTCINFIQIEHTFIQVYITDPKNFADPKVNKEIHKDAHRIIFRSYVQFKTGYKLYLKDKYGRDLFKSTINKYKYPENLDYTWQHVGVFETLMEPPLKFNKWSASENYMEWIQKHTFGVWKLVDLDNWLVGNPLVIPKYDVKQRAVSMSQSQSGTTSSSQPRSLNISNIISQKIHIPGNIYKRSSQSPLSSSNATNQAAMAQENRQAMGKGFDPNNL